MRNGEASPMRPRRLAAAALALSLTAGGVAVAGTALLGGASQGMDTRTIAVREKVFGAANVDHRTGAVRRGVVILSWASVMTYAAAIDGHVVLLDAWVARGEHSGYVPTSAGELAALKPEYVFIGHSHFDHAADAAQIVTESGATVVGTPEHCDQIRSQALTDWGNSKVRCVAAAGRAAPYAATTRVSLWKGVGITTVKVVHSGAQAPDPSDPGGLHQPILPPNDFSVIADHPPTPVDVVHLAKHQNDAENGCLVYQFAVGAFRLTWHDTSGPNKETAPEVYGALRRLPRTSVEVASVQGFGQITNGGRDFRLVVEAVRPKELVPGHHDNWLPGLSTRGELYRPYVVEELNRIPAAQRPVLHWVQDPDDYLRPLVWRINDPQWAR
jgi:hypothetical protein